METETFNFSAALEKLTARERQVANLVREGLTNPEVAIRLGIREGTVKSHLRQVSAKTGASRSQLKNAAGQPEETLASE